ncbi:GreA/GreB family elongation factor [Bradyrhizobium sp. UFLA06-06]
MACSKERRLEGRPPIILTEMDRDILSGLLRGRTIDTDTARLLREEIDRADIVPEGVAPNSVVRLGSEVTFVEHINSFARHARLVVPEQASGRHCLSILTSVGSALIGLGPGQSFHWTEHGRERSIAVLEVGKSRPSRPSMTRRLRRR